ncbi:hypothetical protein OD90_2357 [Dokdonia sp. Hel_I_53]|nr:hypothetical protein OD90_2357 [Dokdonia sp. Hel_I_53]
MKKIYSLNKILIIINIGLFIIPYFGLLFMIITGVVQIILFFIYVMKWNQIPQSNKKQLLVYVAICLIIFIGIYYSSASEYYNDLILSMLLIISGLLELYFLYISKKLSDLYLKSNVNGPQS